MDNLSAIESIFLAALDLGSPEERAAYLDRACGRDPDLRGHVERLLRAHPKVGGFLDGPTPGAGPTIDQPPVAERPGTMIGPYKLMEQIGEGGMGLVFVAEQQHPVRRMVALKIIKPGMDSAQVIARFEAERQALAMMDHTNIAKVHDAGTTESGRPYFVMELVHGIPITDYCDANRLTPRERLELFVPVCHAIQHAHQKGIIHRDIKPSNILVTMYDDKPVPKVIDFGVAKAIEQRLTEKTVYTRFGTLVGTFEYMSPEQAEMNAFGVDTRSDIYSLGVLLYELLTGTTPLERARLREAAFDEIRRLIKEEEPPRPSVRLSTSGALAKVAAARKTEPAKLSRLVRGELDWVAMRCLEKDRSRRYDTASSLARDVERHLRDEPVEARPQSAWYRFRKLARRNKVALTTAALIAAALLLGTAVSLWQAVRADAERDRAWAAEAKARVEKENTQAALDFLWQDLLSQASPWEVADRDLKVRTLIDRAADRLDAGTGHPPLVEATLRRMMAQLYTELGENRKSRPYLEKALEVQRRELAEDDPQLLATNLFLGRCLCISNQYDEAEPILSRTLGLLRRVRSNEHPETLLAMYLTGFCYSALGRYAEGEQLFREALDTLSRRPGNHAREQLGHRCGLGLSLATRGNLDAAESELTRSLEEWRKSGDRADYPPALAVLRTLAWLHVVRDDAAGAEPLAVEALNRIRPIMGDHHLFTINSLRVLARIRQMQGRYPEAAELIAQAEGAIRQLYVVDDARLASVLGMRGLNLVAEKKYAEAEPPLRECLAIWEKRLPHGGEFVFLLSRRGAAREYAFAKCLLGVSLMGREKYAEAAPLLSQGYEGLKPQPGFDEDLTPLARRYRVEALGWLVQLYEEWGKPEEAAKWRRELEDVRPAD